jgi:hypothetical protein
VRAVALGLVVIGAVALFVFQFWLWRRHSLPEMPRPAQGWPWEQPWPRQVLVWGSLAVAMVVGLVLAINIPIDSGWGVATKGLLLTPAVIAAVVQKRRNRREGVGAPPPLMEYGPPGWTWDGDSATWRPPE